MTDACPALLPSAVWQGAPQNVLQGVTQVLVKSSEQVVRDAVAIEPQVVGELSNITALSGQNELRRRMADAQESRMRAGCLAQGVANLDQQSVVASERSARVWSSDCRTFVVSQT